MQECGIPGGIQVTLMPWAVIALLAYTFGYPAFLAQLFYRKRELIMEDQLLRAKGVGDDRLTNPHALSFRKRFSRTYYQFKPTLFYWVLAIILRKFFIAFTSLMFRQNSAFQLAAALLVMFLAYAAQVRFQPYMSPSEREAVLKEHLELSYTSPLHARLRAILAGIESRGRKKTHRNILTVKGRVDARALLGRIGTFMFDYNTVSLHVDYILHQYSKLPYRKTGRGGTAVLYRHHLFDGHHVPSCLRTELILLFLSRYDHWRRHRCHRDFHYLLRYRTAG
jgi:hypothetical protein